jgi:hypothetical protein
LEELVRAPVRFDHDLELRLSVGFFQTTHLGNFMASSSHNRGRHSGVEGFFMPIRRLLEDNDAFSPEDVQVLLGVFDDTLHALNLTDRERPLTMTVAKLIIEFAREGEHPARLRDLVVRTLRPK